MWPLAPADGVMITRSGASATPRNAVLAAAVARSVGVPVSAPVRPLVSESATNSPPPAVPLPPLRVAYSVTVFPVTTPPVITSVTRPVRPRYASAAVPIVPFDTQLPSDPSANFVSPAAAATGAIVRDVQRVEARHARVEVGEEERIGARRRGALKLDDRLRAGRRRSAADGPDAGERGDRRRRVELPADDRHGARNGEQGRRRS